MMITPHICKHISTLYNGIYNRINGLPSIDLLENGIDFLKDLINKDNPTILDIGCNDGYNTLMFFNIFNYPKIYCFEPDPRAIERFKKNVRFHHDIKLFEIALSEQNGEIDFYQSNGFLNKEQSEIMPLGWDLSGSIKQPKKHLRIYPWITFENKIKVRTLTLDEWTEKNYNGIIDLIWIDVQGAEMNVFKGGSETLKRTRYIYTEYSNYELYKGQSKLRTIKRNLTDYQIVKRFSSDVLLENTNFGST